jgi:preprotein translocase subunit SecG
MDTLFKIIMVVQVLSALLIIVLVLLQHGKGADMGAAFGSGASGSLFGATGSSNFISKMTGVAAAVFFACTLVLTYIATNRGSSVTNTGGGVMDSLPVSKAPVGVVPGGQASVPATGSASGTASGPASAAAPAVPADPAASTGAASATSAASTPEPVAPSAPMNQVPK